MAGQFLGRDAIIDIVKDEHRINAVRKRSGLSRHPIRIISYGYSAPDYGPFHVICRASTIPTDEEAISALSRSKKCRDTEEKRIRDIALLRADAVASALALRPAFTECRVSVKTNRRGDMIVVNAPCKIDPAGRRELRQLAVELSQPFTPVVRYS